MQKYKSEDTFEIKQKICMPIADNGSPRNPEDCTIRNNELEAHVILT